MPQGLGCFPAEREAQQREACHEPPWKAVNSSGSLKFALLHRHDNFLQFCLPIIDGKHAGIGQQIPETQTVYNMIRPTLRRTIAGADCGIGSGLSCSAMFGLSDNSDDLHGCANLQLALESTHSERGGHGDLLLTCHPGSGSRLLCPSCLRWFAGVLRDLQHGGVCPFIWCGCLFAHAAVVERSC